MSNKKPGNSTLLLILCSALIILTLGYVFTRIPEKEAPGSLSSPAVFKKTQPSQETSPTANLSLTNIQFKEDFQKRRFDLNRKIYEKYEYPSEMLSVPVDQLSEIRCTPQFFDNYDNTYRDTDKFLVLTDATIQELFKYAAKAVNKEKIHWGSICQFSDNNYLISFGVRLGGGGSSNTAYLGTINKDGQIKKFAQLPNFGVPFFGCGAPLQSTKTEIYIECSGGDGPGSGKAFYKIDINSGQNQKLLECNQFFDEKTGITTTNCK